MLIYGFPSTGKSTLAAKFDLFDSDQLLGTLDSSSDRVHKARVARACRLLSDNGFSGVTNLLDTKPDYVFYRRNASRVRELMLDRGEDPGLVASLDIEGWISGLERRLEGEWSDVCIVCLADDEFIGDYTYMLDLVELDELGEES